MTSKLAKAAYAYGNDVAHGELGERYRPTAPGNDFDEQLCAQDAVIFGAKWLLAEAERIAHKRPDGTTILPSVAILDLKALIEG